MITKTVDEAQLIKNYYKRFLRMDFDGAMKTVGVMTYYRVPDARYYEALLLYELRKFNKVRILLCDKSLSWRERELYIASLAELQLYNDVEDALDNEIQLYNESINLPDRYFPISTYAFYYICYLLEKSGHPYTKTITTTMVEDTYFQDHYKWTIFFDLAEINETNKEISLMKAAQFSKNTIRHTRKKALDMLALIRINDPFLDDIKNAVNSNLEIEIPKLLWFPIRYLGDSEPNGTPKMFHSFSNIYSIIRYTHFLIRLNYPNVELDTFVEYIKELEAEAKKGNEYVLNLLKELFLQTHYFKRHLLSEKEQLTIAGFLKEIIQRYSPFTINEIDLHETDAEIYSSLSTKGQFAYKAAIWQFDNALNTEIDNMDAGMLCLSYMRILELEINQKIFLPLKKYQNQILSQYNNILDSLHNNSSDYSKKWSALCSLNKDGIELGPLYYFLLNFQKDPRDYEIPLQAELIRIFKEYILNDRGMDYLQSGKLADMINTKVREKYRNPPAHTRYVNIDTAYECRKYIETKLKELSLCLR